MAANLNQIHIFVDCSQCIQIYCQSVLSNVTTFLAGMLFISGLLLLYTALVVPIQIFLWENNDPCTLFPTLRIDLFV